MSMRSISKTSALSAWPTGAGQRTFDPSAMTGAFESKRTTQTGVFYRVR